MRFILLLSVFCAVNVVRAHNCNKKTVTARYKKPIYDFSRQILDKVSLATDGHFVFSPILTWMQLTNIAEGAQGKTLKEVLNVTGQKKRTCMQVVLRKILNDVNEDVKTAFKSKSMIIVDKFLGVKRNFKKRLELLNTTIVETLNFDEPYESAKIANEILTQGLEDEVVDVVDPNDFKYTSLLMTDVAYFSSAWKSAFNPSQTVLESFYYGRNVEPLQMMTQTGYFKVIKVESIDANVLELPCLDDKHSMLVFLPIRKNIKDLYLSLKEIRLSTLFNLFKKAPNAMVNVKLPKFTLTTDLDNLPELIHDMGVSYVFDPNRARLRGISDYRINLSGMRQKVKIAVTEEGVSAIAEALIENGTVTSDFIVNQPFGFMLVDKPTEIMLFAGVYSAPQCKDRQC